MIREPQNQSTQDLAQFEAVGKLFEESAGSVSDKLDGFAKFASRQSIAKFLTKYELFQKIVGINGSIVECGVLHGAGTLAWAKLSSILEPANHTRKVIGFDTFGGFVDIAPEDARGGSSAHLHAGGLSGSSLDDVEQAVALYDLNRPISHIQKVELIPGDLCQTAPRYLEENPHLVVSLLYLDVDLYEPTLKALQTFRPRMPKGGVIVFDELNARMFPGETLAVQTGLGLQNIRIERFPFDSYVSYCVLD